MSLEQPQGNLKAFLSRRIVTSAIDHISLRYGYGDRYNVDIMALKSDLMKIANTHSISIMEELQILRVRVHKLRDEVVSNLDSTK